MQKKWIVARQGADDQDTVGLFPTEHGGGATFSLAETDANNRHYSEYFDRLVSAYTNILVQNHSMSIESALPIARGSMIPLAHVFFERCLRLDKLLSMDVPICGVLKAHPVSTPKHCEDISMLASESFDFNQQILNFLAPAFDLDVGLREANTPQNHSPDFNHNYQNHLFYLSRPNIFRRAMRRGQVAWSKRSGRVIAYGLTQTYFPSLDRGLYGRGRFAALREHSVLDTPEPDLRRRHLLLSTMSPISREVINSCLGLWLKSRNLDALNHAFIRIIVNFLPSTLFEGLTSNLERISKELGAYPNARTIYSTGFALHSRAILLCAAARTFGMQVISSQHGGHYGYMKQQTIALEGEFPFADRWVTWGWSSTEAHPKAPWEKFIPLPSPWMSERAIEWNKFLSDEERFDKNKPYDIAFMPNKVYSFCPAPSGAHATGNFLKEFCASMVDFVEKASSSGLRILHKPYGIATVALMPDTLSKLFELGGQNYQLSASLDKGLHPALVRDIGLFVWDQPGTGFLECLAANIPTMVLWPRIYNCENEDAEPFFAAMEAQGLVHRDSSTLVSSALEFKKSPRGWWKTPQRQESARAFMHAYCSCLDTWHMPWKEFIATLR